MCIVIAVILTEVQPVEKALQCKKAGKTLGIPQPWSNHVDLAQLL